MDRPCRPGADMSTPKFWLVSFLVGLALLMASRFVPNEYFFYAGYQVLQFAALATAWNILGGYTGYINFGTGAFFAFGAYSTVVLHKLTNLPLPVMMLVGGLVCGVMGFGVGYLTLRLRGVFFAIATLALAVVAQTLIVNWDFVGGSRGVLGRPDHWRGIARHGAAARDRHALQGGSFGQPADRRTAPHPFRDHRAERHHRPVPGAPARRRAMTALLEARGV